MCYQNFQGKGKMEKMPVDEEREEPLIEVSIYVYFESFAFSLMWSIVVLSFTTGNFKKHFL